MCGEHSSVIPSESYLVLRNEEERLRSIANLQQRAQVLEKELALRENEAPFRLLVEAVQDYAIFMLNPEGYVSSWNMGAERIKGYKAEEIMGRHFSCFYPEEDVRNGKPQRELVVAAKEGRFEDEGWRIRKDGSRFWANVIITAIKDGSGKLIGLRENHAGCYRTHANSKSVGTGSCRKTRRRASISRFRKITPAIVTPPASHPGRRAKAHWKGPPRQSGPVSRSAEDEVGFGGGPDRRKTG